MRWAALWRRVAQSYNATTATWAYEAPADLNVAEIQAGCYGAYLTRKRRTVTTNWTNLVKDEAGAGIKWATGGTAAKGILYDIIDAAVGDLVP
jgi:hypothetical protein